MKQKILLVDDDPVMVELITQILAGVGQVRTAANGQQALQLVREAAPDLILLDAEMPGMSGFQLCEVLKGDVTLADVPVIFLTGHNEVAFEVAGFDAGAADFIAKPINPSLVLARVRAQLRVKRMADELRRTSTIDALTAVANRRGFDESLAREWRRSRRSGEALALLLAEVDHFEMFNRRYGHAAGDACLQSVAQALVQASLRPADLVARCDGEQFALLLPSTPRQGAEHMAHRVLDAVEALAIPHAVSPTAQHVTASVGIATYDEHSAQWVVPSPVSRFGNELRPACSAADLVKAAEIALHAAQEAGRAQARVLDIADVDAPAMAREVAPSLRARRPRKPS